MTRQTLTCHYETGHDSHGLISIVNLINSINLIELIDLQERVKAKLASPKGGNFILFN